MPPQAMPLPSSSQMNVLRQVSTRISAARLGQEAVAGGDHEELHGDDGRQPGRGLQHGRPEHRGQREDDGKQRDGDARRKLVPDEHRQELVLELRLQDVPCERRARSSRICACTAARGSLARGRCVEARWCRCRRASSPSPGRPADAKPAWRRLGATAPERPKSRGKSLNSRLSARSRRHAGPPTGGARAPTCRPVAPARSLHGQPRSFTTV